MAVVAAGASGIAYIADELSLLDRLTGVHHQRQAVGVHGSVAVAMVDDDGVAVAVARTGAVIAGLGDRTACRSVDRRTSGGADIHALVAEVRITKVETWEEEIAYTTETTKSNELNSGTKRVTQKGENGVRTVTAQRVYDTNGNQLSQQILSTVVTKEPVTEKVTVGTKKVSPPVSPPPAPRSTHRRAGSWSSGSGRFPHWR